MKPIIGISCGLAFNTKSVDFSQLPQQFHQLSDTYVTAVERAGGIPVILPSYEDSELAIEAAERLDAVIFSGGGESFAVSLARLVECDAYSAAP